MESRLSRPSDSRRGAEAVINDLVALVNDLGDADGVGVGVPGIVDFERGFLAISPNLPSLNQLPVRDRIEQKLGRPVFLENDANCAALGEAWAGAAKGYPDFLLLTLGTGIGGGIVIGGRILRGAAGMAGELGHIRVVLGGNPCGCGANGCLEKHASATAVMAMARMQGLGDLTCEQIAGAARGGDALAQAVWTSMGTSLGAALATLANVFNFPLYLLSGGLLPAWDLFAPSMQAELERGSYVSRYSPAKVERATLSGDAGLYGAGWLAMTEKPGRT
jgi:glucokinase